MQVPRLTPLAHKPPVVLGTLLLLAILGFAAVHRLVSRFQSRETVVATQLYLQGKIAERSGNSASAIRNFRAALGFAPTNYEYALSLAQSLLASGQYDQAGTYLLNLWDRAPQNGQVNLDLARLAAHNKNTDEAIRFYHNAIYGIWPGQLPRHRQARLELVDFLLEHNQPELARAELIASSAEIPADPALHAQLADRFLRIEDYQGALTQYRLALRLEPSSVPAMDGAAKAAFQMGEFETAQSFAQLALNSDAHDDAATQLLRMSREILAADPFRRGISDRDERSRSWAAYMQAGKRLDACLLAENESSPDRELDQLHAEWHALNGKLVSASAQNIMDLVYRIELQARKSCGAPEGDDLVLTLLAQHRERGDR